MVVCPTLLNPMEGRVVLTGTLVGSQAAYSCNEGLVLNGNRTRICRADGRWSGSEPTCDTPPGMAKQMQNDPVAFRPGDNMLACMDYTSLSFSP